MSRKISGGSSKPGRGVTLRVYRVFYLSENGVEVQHARKVFGYSRAEAVEMAIRVCGVTPSRLKL
jgi:hypothetical protein